MCNPKIVGDMIKNIEIKICQNTTFCKKKNRQNDEIKFQSVFHSKLFENHGKSFKRSNCNFLQFASCKGETTFKHFKNASSKATIYRIMNTFDENGNVDRKSGSGRPQKLSVRQKWTKKSYKDVN